VPVRISFSSGALLFALAAWTSPASGDPVSSPQDDGLGDSSSTTPPVPDTTVHPPRLQTFQEAEYPAQARALGVEGEVVLELEIDPDGAVMSSRVVKPAGHGFDEAAQAASLKFRFLPARRGDKAVAARIRYLYTFKLSAVPQEDRSRTARPTPAGDRGGRYRSRACDRHSARRQCTRALDRSQWRIHSRPNAVRAMSRSR
jgi:TonB family protein